MVMRLVREADVQGDWLDAADLDPGAAETTVLTHRIDPSNDVMPSDARDEPQQELQDPEGGSPAPPEPAAASGPPAPAEDPDGAVGGTPTIDDRGAVGRPDASGGGDDDGGADEPDEVAAGRLRILEALLLSTHHPLTPARLAELLDLPSVKPVRAAVQTLNEQYAATGRSFRVEQVAGGYQILTLPEFGDALKRLHQKEGDAKLTKAALETLSIIAYKQPILRADIEAIRGVACGETIRSLMEKHLVKIAGRAEEPGRPILYGTTRRFLELFGLNTLKDLPQPQAQPESAPPAVPPLPQTDPEAPPT